MSSLIKLLPSSTKTGRITKYVHIKSTTVYAPRRNWDFPQPPTRRLVCSLPPVSGGRGTLAGEKGVGRVPIPTRGVHCGTLYMYCTYFVGRMLLATDREKIAEKWSS
jgi:hypothetical protein